MNHYTTNVPVDIEYEAYGVSRRGRCYRAKLGAYEASGRTKAAAKQALFALIASEPSDYIPVPRVDARGNAWCLSRVPGSWAYSAPSGCVTMLGGTEKEALDTMLRHMEQYCA